VLPVEPQAAAAAAAGCGMAQRGMSGREYVNLGSTRTLMQTRVYYIDACV